MKDHAQRGYLLMSAIVLIVIVGFLAATMTYLFTTGAFSSAMQLDSVRAFYAARSGLETVAYRLLSPDLSQRLTCAEVEGEYGDLPGTQLFSTPYTAFFTAQASSSFINRSDVVLAASINSTADVIPINVVVGSVDYVSPRGRVLIDREAIDYRGISTDCGLGGGYSFCLVDVTRNANLTGATGHFLGTPVTQNQCLVTVSGGVPELSSPTSHDPKPRSRLIGEIKQLETGWIVGGGKIVRWNGARWFEEKNFPGVTLNDVETLSYGDSWAIGYDSGIGRSVLAYLYNGLWVLLPNSFTEVLKGVTCVDYGTCHAVGDHGLFLTLLRVGVAMPLWIQKGIGMTSESINSVSCSDSTNCRAVGDFETLPDSSTKSVFAEWNGTDWIRTLDSSIDSGVPVENLRGIACVRHVCHAVGANSTFVRWTGSQWVNAPSVAFPPGVRMNDVYCVNAIDCWAVGNVGIIAHWDGSAWSVNDDVGSANLNSVTCAGAKDCWAVGSNRTIVHFDGTSWNTDFVIDGGVATNNFQGVCFIADHNQWDISWHEDFG